jgi:hypothetical protein
VAAAFEAMAKPTCGFRFPALQASMCGTMGGPPCANAGRLAR